MRIIVDKIVGKAAALLMAYGKVKQVHTNIIAKDAIKVFGKYNIVKTKPYIDFDALEKALYDEALSKDQIMDIDKARETKEVVTLRVSKAKKKEED